jgi:hypothetical protein
MRSRNIQTPDFLHDGFVKRMIQGVEQDDSKRRIKFVSRLIEELHKDDVPRCSGVLFSFDWLRLLT